MGFALDTNETFKLVLWNDRAKPQPPALIFRFLSARDTRRVSKLLEQWDKAQAESMEGLFEKAIEAIKIGLVGWENMGQPFNPDDLDAVLTPMDISEVANRWLSEQTLTEADRKKSARQSSSSTAVLAAPHA